MEKPTLEAMMANCRRYVELLEANLPAALDPLMSRSKLPFKAMYYREAAAWRNAELTRGALDSFEGNKLAVGILATRAAFETSAALWYLKVELDGVIRRRALGGIDERLMALAFGIRSEPGEPHQAINVLTFIDCANKSFRGLRRQYDILSEYAHPNWAGTAHLYSKNDHENVWTELGSNVSDLRSTKRIGVRGLGMALQLLQSGYNGVGDAIPEFIKVCEGMAAA